MLGSNIPMLYYNELGGMYVRCLCAHNTTSLSVYRVTHHCTVSVGRAITLCTPGTPVHMSFHTKEESGHQVEDLYGKR